MKEPTGKPPETDRAVAAQDEAGLYPSSGAATTWGVGAGIVGFVTSALLGIAAAAVTMDPDDGATFIAIWFWLAGAPISALTMRLATWWRRWDPTRARQAAATTFITCLLCDILAIATTGP